MLSCSIRKPVAYFSTENVKHKIILTLLTKANVIKISVVLELLYIIDIQERIKTLGHDCSYSGGGGAFPFIFTFAINCFASSLFKICYNYFLLNIEA